MSSSNDSRAFMLVEEIRCIEVRNFYINPDEFGLFHAVEIYLPLDGIAIQAYDFKRIAMLHHLYSAVTVTAFFLNLSSVQDFFGCVVGNHVLKNLTVFLSDRDCDNGDLNEVISWLANKFPAMENFSFKFK